MRALGFVARFAVALAFAASPLLCIRTPDAPRLAPQANESCRAVLRRLGIEHVEAPPTLGVDDPIQITGDVAGIRLHPRGKRPALMDCRLALALHQAAEHFRAAGIDRLEYSAAYDYRTRRRSHVLSAHAQGLAIDVHVLRGPHSEYVVERDFGPRLRALVDTLKERTNLCVIVTPDDDRDHRDHLHLEASC